MPSKEPREDRCGAKCRNGGYCTQKKMPNGRCRMHGGKSLKGSQVGTYKHGRTSKYLPTRLQEKYLQAMDDEKLLELREDIAVNVAMLQELYSMLGDESPADLFKDCRLLAKRTLDLQGKGKGKAAAQAMRELYQRIDEGATQMDRWQQIVELQDHKRRLVESERKRLVEAELMMPAEQAMLLIAAVTDTIRRHVTDRKQLAKIHDDLNSTLSLGPTGRA